MTVLIAAAGATDLPQVRDLFREYHRWVDQPECFANFERELTGLPGEYAPPRGRLLIARAEDQLAGCAALRPFDAGRCEMKRLYVRPAFHGLGLGRRLAQAMIEAARASGANTLLLDTLPQMGPAIALYRSLGFASRDAYASAPTPGALFFELQL
jgi:ribosomal protein S18 acetylase RimI-like enzyme